MAERRGNGGANYWVIVIAVVGVVMSVGNGFWSIANPSGNIKELKDDLGKLRDEVRWQYATKELTTGLVNENKSWREGIERIIGRIETKANGLDTEIHGTYSPKDALAQIQARVIELERALRSPSAAQPKPPLGGG